MQQWEYEYVSIRRSGYEGHVILDVGSEHGERAYIGSIVDALNSFGDEGWEMVNCTDQPTRPQFEGTGTFRAVFKRPKE